MQTVPDKEKQRQIALARRRADANASRSTSLSSESSADDVARLLSKTTFGVEHVSKPKQPKQQVYTSSTAEKNLKKRKHPEIRRHEEIPGLGRPHPLADEWAKSGWIESAVFSNWRALPNVSESVKAQRAKYAMTIQDEWPAPRPYETRAQFKPRQERWGHNYTNEEIEDMFTWRLVHEPYFQSFEDYKYLPEGMELISEPASQMSTVLESHLARVGDAETNTDIENENSERGTSQAPTLAKESSSQAAGVVPCTEPGCMKRFGT